MRNFTKVRENLERANRGLLALKKQMTAREYLEEKYLMRQVCISSVALSCLNDSVDEFLVFQCSLDEEDRLLLLSLTGER